MLLQPRIIVCYKNRRIIT